MSNERIYAAISDAFYDARNSGRTMTQAAKAATAAVEAIVTAHTNAAVEQARAEVEAGWVAAVEALADEKDEWAERCRRQIPKSLLHQTHAATAQQLRALLTADHTAALDAVTAEAAREALLDESDLPMRRGRPRR